MLERCSIWLWGLCALAYVYVFPYQATLNNPNENVRFYMTAALVDSHSYAIDAQRERWGWVNDAAVRDDHVYSVKAPGTSLLGVPGYALYKAINAALGRDFVRTEALWVCRFSASILPTWWAMWWFAGFLRRRNYALPVRLACCVALWLGSLLYAYGMLFVSHTLSAIVAFCAFAGLMEVQRREREATPLWAAGSGVLAASTTLFEYPGLVASAVLLGYALYSLRSWKLRGSWLLGAALPALLMMHFQNSAFGSPFTPGHLFVENDSFRSAHEQGLYGAVGISATALYGLLLDPGAGLFPLTPLLWFALPGFWLMLRSKPDRAAGLVSLGLCTFTTLAIAAMNNWRGGWTMGPRYLAVCVPFLGHAAAHALDALARRAPLTAASLALGTSTAAVVASGIPSAYYPHLPPEITRPLPQLFSVLIRHGFAPLNASNLLGIWGSGSLLPLLLCALAALGLCVWSVTTTAERSATARLRRLAAVGCSAIALAGLCLAPLALRPREDPRVRKAVAFVTSRFFPSGHDRAARLRAQLSAAGSATTDAAWDKLAALYREEGRDREAAAASRHEL